MKQLIIVYITVSSKKVAKEIAMMLLNERLVACINFVSVESMCWWQSNIEFNDEVVILAKTTANLYETIKKQVKLVHPYDVPCIITIPVQANQEYSEYVINETKQN